MHREVRKKANNKGKSDIRRVLPGAERVTNKFSDSIPFWQLPLMVAMICDLSSGPKWLYAKLNFDAWGRSWDRVGDRSLAKALGVDRATIHYWLSELVRCGLIKVVHERACCCYYLYPRFRFGGFIPLLAETMKRRDVGWAYKLVLCCISYRMAGNDWCWAKQKALAEDLGLSVRTIQRILAAMKARGEVQIRLRRHNRKGGNKYALTCGAVLGGRVFGNISHTTKYPPLNKKWMLKSYFKRRRLNFPSGDLSASNSRALLQTELVFSTLAGYGVHEKVARPLAFEDKHPFESVVQAHLNGQILRAQFWQRFADAGLPNQEFNLPGYVVAALNGARKNGKTVGTTRLFREAEEMSRTIKLAKEISAKRKRPSDAEWERRRRAQIRALGLPA